MKQILIGLHGLARTGKDTAANYLVAHYLLAVYAFASPLKTALQQMFNLTAEQLNGALKETPLPIIGKSPRELMQLLGTEWGRHSVHNDLWLLLARQNMDNMLELQDGYLPGFVISDVRFENEATWIRAQGGTVLHLLRPDAAAVNPHISEAGVAIHDNDLVIHNDADLQHLYTQLDHLMLILSRRQALRSAA
ncbi:MAG: deoxynucleotide monophosphate kinase [Pseudomonas sp.]|uniref:deoxynucleotide monophosphate kinase family protein n=1 Tax=Pseudomonas sp. TaxID=306 RepID=UPI0027352F37|nr:deoxynucleotide monophosphate kinase [Pseudomonas sp.]MDP3848602.1 deoxynucleotide monophosphate kinase [Pseudomonas sp.]